MLQAYAEAVAGDGTEGRMVVVIDEEGPGGHWECHPGGDEVIVCISGTVTVVREVRELTEQVVLRPARPPSTRAVRGTRWTRTGPRAS